LSVEALTISVVIVAYRSGDALSRCLRSLHEHAPEAEVIVVDNAGADRELVVAAGATLVEPGANLGYAAGSNLGVASAKGDAVVFLNPDTVVAAGALQQLARTLEDELVGIAMARLRLLKAPELLNSSGTVVHVSGLAWAGGYREPADSLSELREVAAPSGAAMAIRRKVFDELGGFTGELFMYLEDMELGWRARLHGLRIVVDPAADVYHDYEFERNPSKLALLERNRLVFVHTAYSLRLLLLLSPVLVGGELAMIALAARHRWLRGKLGGWWWVARHARWLVRHRRETQRLRIVPDRELAHFLVATLDPKMMSLPRGTDFLNRLLGGYWSLIRKAL
jgi:GT2 family glycosyltransferase